MKFKNIHCKNILIDLEINYEEFVDLCILCGCDYTCKIKGIGPINAYKLIKKYKTIELIIKNPLIINILYQKHLIILVQENYF